MGAHSATIIDTLAEERVARMDRFYSTVALTAENVRMAIVDLALSFMAVTEVGSSNSSYWVDRYLSDLGLGAGYAWCMAFVQWPIKHLCALWKKPDLLANNSASTKAVFDWAEGLGLTTKNIDEIQPGDILVWQDGAKPTGHTAILGARVARTIATIEGNTSSASWRDGGHVEIKTYTLDPKTFGVRDPDKRWLRGAIRIEQLMQHVWS